LSRTSEALSGHGCPASKFIGQSETPKPSETPPRWGGASVPAKSVPRQALLNSSKKVQGQSPDKAIEAS